MNAFQYAILDEIDVGIITVDVVGDVSFANATARRMLCLDRASVSIAAHALIGLRAEGRTLLGTSSKWTAVIDREIGGVPHELEVSITRPTRDTAVDLLYVLRDVTEERTLHAEMQRVARLAAMGTMVAGFAHEVRNPVASMRGLVESLAEEMAERGVKLPHPARMLEVLARVERLVTTSLRFGRPAIPRRALHAPSQIVSAAVAAIANRARGQSIRLEISPDLPRINVDEGQLAQVLVILLDNALDAAGSANRVLLRGGLAGLDRDRMRKGSEPPPSARQAVKLEVINNGPPIHPEVIDRIFDPFFTTKPTGVGLGLSIAQQLVAENGARLEVSSGEGAPTVFTITCPAEA